MLNWPDYLDVDDDGDPYYPGGTLDRLRQDVGVEVVYNPDYLDNGESFAGLLDAINSSPPIYDIVVPTYWRAAELIGDGRAEPLPLEVIPNHVNIDPVYLTNAWDRGCRYQMPWQAGITGIVYDPAKFDQPITSVRELFNPSLAGRVSLVPEMREAVGIVMLAYGDGDPSRADASGATTAYQRIADAYGAGQFGPKIDSGNLSDLVGGGQIDAALAWSGDVSLLQADRPDLAFVVPDEGAIQWFDTMVIPAGSANLEAAGRFMDFVYDPDNAAAITEWVGYMSPVVGVRDALRARGGDSVDLAGSSLLFPDGETRSRLFTWAGLDDTDLEADLDASYNNLGT
jgi:spermidine/putrescine transport system substrate-binding protein